jgi:hypothetical protein
MNVKLLRKVKKHILEEPRRLAMGYFVQRKDGLTQTVFESEARDGDEYPFAKCGTAACIAGWTVLLTDQTQEWQIEQNAIRLLEIDGREAQRLFYVHSWPEKLRNKYHNLKTPAARANVAARRIDHFIKTNGAE